MRLAPGYASTGYCVALAAMVRQTAADAVEIVMAAGQRFAHVIKCGNAEANRFARSSTQAFHSAPFSISRRDQDGKWAALKTGNRFQRLVYGSADHQSGHRLYRRL